MGPAPPAATWGVAWEGWQATATARPPWPSRWTRVGTERSLGLACTLSYYALARTHAPRLRISCQPAGMSVFRTAAPHLLTMCAAVPVMQCTALRLEDSCHRRLLRMLLMSHWRRPTTQWTCCRAATAFQNVGEGTPLAPACLQWAPAAHCQPAYHHPSAYAAINSLLSSLSIHPRLVHKQQR
jgi:hypothetical protein